MNPTALIEELRAAREYTRLVADDLGGPRELGPLLAIVNPPRWEVGHVGWFQEYWCLRRTQPDRYSGQRSAPILPNADALYNSATVPHDSRWELPLPPFADTLAFRDEVLLKLLERLQARCDEDDAYFSQLAARHELMHAEAFHYTRQTLSYPAPRIAAAKTHPGNRVEGDVELPGGPFRLGAAPDGGFAFDNEKWAHPVVLKPFRMARTAVTNAEFLAFVEAGGYGKREYWSEEGWRWLQGTGCKQPVYWRKDGSWQLRRFDKWIALPPDEAVIHVNWHEANAYCGWAGRRLPTEAEWEYAATFEPASGRKRLFPWGDEPWDPSRANLFSASPASVHEVPAGDTPAGLRQMIGNVWEWTSSDFLPYPGFLRDPYKEYSEPWFGNHKVLRGGCYATSPRLVHGAWRNFYMPDRADVFAGLRTCAP
jgi:iron(II)-dependent oxidoreductase